MNVLLMADKQVGLSITNWLLSHYPDDLALIITPSETDVYKAAKDAGVPCHIFKSSKQVCQLIDEMNISIDVGLLAWWPKIIYKSLLSKPRMGFINTHPSLLPYNRGKHYNFWAIVEKVPFGVSLHKVEEGIDSGAIIAQKHLPRTWEDNGETLFYKAQKAMLKLFRETYPSIRTGSIKEQVQNIEKGSFRQAFEMEQASQINLDDTYKARDLLNLLRARTFDGHPACFFYDKEEIFEVRVQIKKKKS